MLFILRYVFVSGWGLVAQDLTVTWSMSDNTMFSYRILHTQKWNKMTENMETKQNRALDPKPRKWDGIHIGNSL